MKNITLITLLTLSACASAPATAQTSTQVIVSGNSAGAASASHTTSRSSVGGDTAGTYSVRNSSGASNISGAAITRKRDGNTYVGVTETWSDGNDYSSTVNRGGVGYANSSQSGSAAATYYSGQNPWLQSGW
mgnify:CR=1 FL=1